MEFQVFSMNEWLYPDSRVNENAGQRLELSTARGSYAACQILLNDVRQGAEFRFDWKADADSKAYEALKPEVNRLIDIFVEKNTGPVGFTVKEGESAEGYTTRTAPFRVYDAIEPIGTDALTCASTEALYICWRIPADIQPGRMNGELTVTVGTETIHIPVNVHIYSAVVPVKESLSVINWFSVPDMASRHRLQPWSEEHWDMIRRYGEVMRRARQTHFWVPMEVIDIKETGEGTYHFNFEKAERLIRLYLNLGFSGIEGGLPAGREDFWGSEFVIWACGKTIKALSSEGYAYLSQFLTAWRAFLEERGWLPLLIQHVADEPTKNSKQEYRILSGIVRKFMPGVPLIEAVETYDLAGAADILVPKNVYYQEHMQEFEKLRAAGDKLWFYTCCYPGGSYLNRLWDMPLLRTRYLHWGNYKYQLEGYLHWGLNFCDDKEDPFEQKNLVFPPGDTHITYPGADGPLASMRLEAMRAGIEDYELLQKLAARDKALADKITAECVTSFSEVNEDPDHFDHVHCLLLKSVSEYKEQ